MSNPRSTSLILHDDDRDRVEFLQVMILQELRTRTPSQNRVLRTALRMVATDPDLRRKFLVELVRTK